MYCCGSCLWYRGTAAVAACRTAATVLQCSWNRYLRYCCKRYLRYRRRLLSMSAFVTRCLRAHAMNRCSSSLCNGASGGKGSKWAIGRGCEAVQGRMVLADAQQLYANAAPRPPAAPSIQAISCVTACSPSQQL